ncbi:MAG: NUDIX hydrolase [Deltaproteobacteria bacterium]|nr:NUDIX hydrolase [Deltaproteobacteria bacterium]
MLKPWKKISSKLLNQTRVFSLYSERSCSPDGSHEDDFFYLECPSWVNVIPLTDNGEVVLIRQYRHGTKTIELEIPGGIVDCGEDPEATAVRELKEETGYVSSHIESLGFTHANPAIQTNRCYSYLATGCKLNDKQNLDPAEDIAVELVPLASIPTLLRTQQITHSLVVCAFAFYYLRESS